MSFVCRGKEGALSERFGRKGFDDIVKSFPGELRELLKGYVDMELEFVKQEEVGRVVLTTYRDRALWVVTGQVGEELGMIGLAQQKQDGFEYTRFVLKKGQWEREAGEVWWDEETRRIWGL